MVEFDDLEADEWNHLVTRGFPYTRYEKIVYCNYLLDLLDKLKITKR